MHPTNGLRLIAASAALAFVILPAPRLAAAVRCAGDCNGSGTVDIAELMTGVNILLDDSLLPSCPEVDVNGDGRAEVYELIGGVRRALDGCPAYPLDDSLRLNQIQVLGTHNSYHIRADPPVLAEIVAIVGQSVADLISYDHPPLTEQFDTQGIRQIELDVFADPVGGLYASPLGLQLVAGTTNARIPELEPPGFKVFHLQDIDYKTVCRTFVGCLQEVKAWSDGHPGHVPLMIQVEAKDDVIPDLGGYHFVVPVPIGTAELDAVDAEIRSVFPSEQLITPDDVRGTHATLREAVTTDGWPTLGATRGRVLFCLDNEGKRDAYLSGHPSLQGRVMFTPAPADAADTAFRKLNDPIGDREAIEEAVDAGFIVRTRSDADTVEARTNNTAPRESALASGAQWVSTDYPVPDPDFGTGFKVEIPGGMPARCNPRNAPEGCTSLDIENPAQLAE